MELRYFGSDDIKGSVGYMFDAASPSMRVAESVRDLSKADSEDEYKGDWRWVDNITMVLKLIAAGAKWDAWVAPKFAVGDHVSCELLGNNLTGVVAEVREGWKYRVELDSSSTVYDANPLSLWFSESYLSAPIATPEYTRLPPASIKLKYLSHRDIEPSKVYISDTASDAMRIIEKLAGIDCDRMDREYGGKWEHVLISLPKLIRHGLKWEAWAEPPPNRPKFTKGQAVITLSCEIGKVLDVSWSSQRHCWRYFISIPRLGMQPETTWLNEHQLNPARSAS